MLCLIKRYQSPFFLIGNQITTLVSGIVLLWGTYCYINKKFPKVWIYLSVVTVGWIIISILQNFSFLLITLPTFSFLALIYISTGVLFLKSKNLEQKENAIVGIAFILWGVHKLDYPFLRPLVWFAPWGYLIGAVLAFIVALGMLIVYFQKTRNELKSNEEKYRRLTENAKDMIYRMSLPDGEYEYVSPASETIFGFPPESWYANPILIQDIIHPDFHEYFKEKWQLLLKGELDPSYEYKILFEGDQTRWIHQRNVGIWDKKGGLIAIEGIVTDITDRRQAEETIQQSEALKQKMFTNIGDVIVIIDKEGTNRYKSPNIEKLFGWKPEEVVGKSTWENIHPDDLPSTQLFFQTLMKEPDSVRKTECRYKCKDGIYKWIEFIGTNLINDPDI
ncbi:MAG: PAS domain S-box protein [Desulfobacter sp.]|nr:MAG: PAS domain S-box protein [Desulfobacter sp.]